MPCNTVTGLTSNYGIPGKNLENERILHEKEAIQYKTYLAMPPLKLLNRFFFLEKKFIFFFFFFFGDWGVFFPPRGNQKEQSSSFFNLIQPLT